MAPIYEKLFSLIISTGKIPNISLEGVIMPVFKNKGAKTIHKTTDLILF